MTSKHTLSNGQGIWLKSFTGEVLSEARHFHTSISQADPIVLSDKLVAPGAIHSAEHESHRVWLRDAAGAEKEVDLANVKLSLRPGHVVTAVWGSSETNAKGTYLAARNHTTGELRHDVVAALGDDLKQWQLDIGLWPSFFKWAGAGALFGIILLEWFSRNERGGTPLSLFFVWAMVGCIPVLTLWGIFGIRLGPNKRANELVLEINNVVKDRLLAQAAA